MEVLFDTIFGNILVILAIIGGIAGFIKDRNNKDADSSRPYSTPTPTPTPSGGYNQANYEEVAEIGTGSLNTNHTDISHRAIEGGEHDAIVKRSRLEATSSVKKKNKMKRQMKQSLSKQGLVNGIIMSEVLGPPRAKKPYKSVLNERKK